MLGRLFGMCMVFNIQWARLAFSKYLLFLSFILTCTPKVRQKTFGVLLCLKSTGNMAMQND